MITRAQAEALLTLAESLEACERLGVTLGSDSFRDIRIYFNGRSVLNTASNDVRPSRIRQAVEALLPKQET